MIGGWMWMAQWAKKIEQKRKEHAEQRESSMRRRRRHRVGGQELHRIKLTEDEKQRLRVKINEQAQKTTHA